MALPLVSTEMSAGGFGMSRPALHLMAGGPILQPCGPLERGYQVFSE